MTQENDGVNPIQRALADSVPGFPALSRRKVEGELNTEFISLKSGYDTFKAARMKMYKEYKFQKYGNEREGESQIVDSSIWDAIEWMVPTLIQPYIETSEFVKIAPQDSDFQKILVAQTLKELLSFQVRKKTDWYQILYDTIKGFLIQRESFVKVAWQERDAKNNEPVSRPVITATPAAQIRYDWTAQTFSQSHVVTQEEDMSRSDILKLMRDAPGLMEGPFKVVLAAPGRNFKTARLRDEEQAQPNWVGEDQTKMNKNHTLYLRREHWTTYSLNGGEDSVAVMAVFIDDTLVQLIENPYPFKKPPFVQAECVRDVLGNPAQSWSEVLSDIQRYKTAILRLTANNLNAQQNGVYEYDQNNVDEIGVQLLQHAPSGMRIPIPVNKPGSVTAIPVTPIAQHAFTVWELLEVAKENRSGFTRYSQGLDSKSLNQTATGIISITQRSEMRMWEMAKRMGEMFIKPLTTMLIMMNQEFLERQDLELQFGSPEFNYTDKEGKRHTIPATKAGDWISLAKHDLGGHFNVEIDVDIGADRQTKIDNGLQWAQFFGPFIGQGVPIESMTIMALQTAKAMGLKQIELIMEKEMKTIGSGGVSVPAIIGAEPSEEVGPTTGQEGGAQGLLSPEGEPGL